MVIDKYSLLPKCFNCWYINCLLSNNIAMEKFLEEMTRPKSKLMKVTLGILAAIFLSIIGNALWEFVFRSIFNWIGMSILTGLAFVFSGFVDILHAGIGGATIDPYPYRFWVQMAYCMFFGILTGYLAAHVGHINRRVKGTIEEESAGDLLTSEKKNLRSGKYFFVLVMCAYFLFFMVMTTREGYVSNACKFVERSIEMLAPKLSETQVLELRAKYRGVDNSEKFYSLETEIKGLSQKQGVKIPDFKSIKPKR